MQDLSEEKDRTRVSPMTPGSRSHGTVSSGQPSGTDHQCLPSAAPSSIQISKEGHQIRQIGSQIHFLAVEVKGILIDIPSEIEGA